MKITEYLSLNNKLLKKVLGEAIFDDKDGAKNQKRDKNGKFADEGKKTIGPDGEHLAGTSASESDNNAKKGGSKTKAVKKTAESKEVYHQLGPNASAALESNIGEVAEEGGGSRDYLKELQRLQKPYDFRIFARDGLQRVIDHEGLDQTETDKLVAAAKKRGEELTKAGMDVSRGMEILNAGNYKASSKAKSSTKTASTVAAKPTATTQPATKTKSTTAKAKAQQKVKAEPETKAEPVEKAVPQKTEKAVKSAAAKEPETQQKSVEGPSEIIKKASAQQWKPMNQTNLQRYYESKITRLGERVRKAYNQEIKAFLGPLEAIEKNSKAPAKNKDVPWLKDMITMLREERGKHAKWIQAQIDDPPQTEEELAELLLEINKESKRRVRASVEEIEKRGELPSVQAMLNAAREPGVKRDKESLQFLKSLITSETEEEKKGRNVQKTDNENGQKADTENANENGVKAKKKQKYNDIDPEGHARKLSAAMTKKKPQTEIEKTEVTPAKKTGVTEQERNEATEQEEAQLKVEGYENDPDVNVKKALNAQERKERDKWKKEAEQRDANKKRLYSMAKELGISIELAKKYAKVADPERFRFTEMPNAVAPFSAEQAENLKQAGKRYKKDVDIQSAHLEAENERANKNVKRQRPARNKNGKKTK